MRKDTSWGNVAKWYAGHLAQSDSYHATVILPNLLRVMDIKIGEEILDLACGTGFFSLAFVRSGAKVTGVDIGAELVKHAREAAPEGRFFVSPAHRLEKIKSGTIKKIAIVLAIQNIKEVKEMIAECKRVLGPDAAIYIVMNHPAYRIPKGSSWGWDDKDSMQFRRIDYYLSEKSVPIEMHPGKSNNKKQSAETVSFHRPLQYYFKLLNNAGFAVTRLEEWISNKKSEKGMRQKEEDRMRREIPLFMLIEARKLQ